MKRHCPFLLRGSRQLNRGALLSGAGFLLYALASVLGWARAAEGLALLFGLVSLYVLLSAALERHRDKAAVSLNLLLGQGALVLLAGLCLLAMLKERGVVHEFPLAAFVKIP